MRDLRADLEDRLYRVERQMREERARFEHRVSQLVAEREQRIAHLEAQLRLANKLIEFIEWEERVRMAVAARVAAAEAAERSIRASLERYAELIAGQAAPSPAAQN